MHMRSGKDNIRIYVIALVLTAVLIMSGAVMYSVSSSKASTIEDTPAQVPASDTGPSAADTAETAETEVMISRGNELFEDMESGKSFCFVGDSITRGSVTDYVPWYDPMTPFIRGEIMNFSEGGWTSKWLVDLRDQVPVADVYVVAIGINDVLYIDQPLGAASVEEFIGNLQVFTDAVLSRNPEARMYFITPWPFLNFPDETYALCDEFSNAMKAWCDGESRICIDPFDTIMSVLNEVDVSVYMYNDYHPNAPEGIGLYSYAVMQAANRAS